MSAFDLVVFDLDGTLADTKRDLADATNHTLQTLGLPVHDLDEITSFVGGGLVLLLKRALGKHGGDPAMLERAKEIFVPWYREHMLDATRPYPGTERMLDRIAAAGIPMAIATNKPRVFTAGIVDALFPDRFTPVVACGDDAPRKPDPLCVQKCLEAHPGVKRERVLFVGDSLVDVETARAANVAVLACGWGFGKRDELEKAKPDFFATETGEIADVALRKGAGS